MKTFNYILLALILAFAAAGVFADSKQVMAARRRAQIVATAKALFDPEIKKSIKIGRVENPFGAAR